MTKETAAENRILLTERRRVAERVNLRVAECRTVAAEGVVGHDHRIAVVGEVDRVNQNGRVYPMAEWQRNIGRINAASARMLGAVDHVGAAEGGNLKGSPIVWESLRLRDDGLVEGTFRVLDGHSAGRDFLAQIEGGAAIGFSSFGFATGRTPTAAEQAKYELTAEQVADGAVIIEDWDLVQIDAVNHPAVTSAWLCRQHASESILSILNDPVQKLTAGELDVQSFANSI